MRGARHHFCTPWAPLLCSFLRKNAESGVPLNPHGCQRVSKCVLKCFKKTSKIGTPLQERLQGCLGCPTASKIPPFFTFPRPGLPQVGGTFEPSPPALSYTPLTSSFANVKHPSSAAVWAYAHLDMKNLGKISTKLQSDILIRT